MAGSGKAPPEMETGGFSLDFHMVEGEGVCGASCKSMSPSPEGLSSDTVTSKGLASSTFRLGGSVLGHGHLQRPRLFHLQTWN